MRTPESSFESYKSKANFVFRLLNVSFSFRSQSAQKTCLRFAIFIFNEKLQNIFEIGLKKYGAIVQKSLSKKKMFRNKKFANKILFFIS